MGKARLLLRDREYRTNRFIRLVTFSLSDETFITDWGSHLRVELGT